MLLEALGVSAEVLSDLLQQHLKKIEEISLDLDKAKQFARRHRGDPKAEKVFMVSHWTA